MNNGKKKQPLTSLSLCRTTKTPTSCICITSSARNAPLKQVPKPSTTVLPASSVPSRTRPPSGGPTSSRSSGCCWCGYFYWIGCFSLLVSFSSFPTTAFSILLSGCFCAGWPRGIKLGKSQNYVRIHLFTTQIRLRLVLCFSE